MPYSLLKEKLRNVKEFSTEFWDSLESHLYRTHYDKDDLWLTEGHVAKRIGFIVEGGAKSYVMKKGDKLIDRLWNPDSFLLPPSALTQEESNFSIQFTSSSHVIRISIEALLKLGKTHEEANYYMNYFLGQEFNHFITHIRTVKSHRTKDLHLKSADLYRDQYWSLPNSEKGTYFGVGEKQIRNIINNS